MEWFYRLDGHETGPVSANDLKALFKVRTITAETQVRRNDMREWQPLGQFLKGASTPPPKTPVAASSEAAPPARADRDVDTPAGPLPAAAPPSSRCSECGRAYAPDTLIQFDDARICTNCKPLFVRKLREGVRVHNGLAYAGFWIRFGAKFIDGLVLFVINMAFWIAFALATGGDDSVDAETNEFLLQAIYLCMGAVYTTFFLGRFGATPGKMACGLKVVAPAGGSIGYPRALRRQLAEYLSGLILLIGYIMAAFDGEKRALHDRICRTRVVRN